MKITWVKFHLVCHHCGKEVDISELAFSSNGKTLVGGLCHCGQVISNVMTWEQIISTCVQSEQKKKLMMVQPSNNYIN